MMYLLCQTMCVPTEKKKKKTKTKWIYLRALNKEEHVRANNEH